MNIKPYTFQNYCDENGLEYTNIVGLWFIDISQKHDSTIKFLENNINDFDYKISYHGIKTILSMAHYVFSKELYTKNTFLDVNVEGHLFRLVIDKRYKNNKIEYIKQLRNLCPLNASKIGTWDVAFNCSHDGKLHLKEAKEIVDYALSTQPNPQYTDLNVGLYLL